MELTLDQALQKGIQAHKAGQVQEADRLYTAILKAQPKHPDANYNMGVLAVGVGKVEQALPFFKTALEANPATAQFWLSYVDALIKLEQLADAKAVLDQARIKGAKGYGFDKLEQRLKQSGQEALVGSPIGKASKVQNPPQDQVQSLMTFYNNGQLALVVEHAQVLTKQYPEAFAVWNLMGASAAQIGQLDLAVFAFQRCLAIKPDNAGAHNNMGNTLKEQGELEQAIEAYKKALAIKPDYAAAHLNMGNALQEQGEMEQAIEAYHKALAIQPDYAEAYYNMGNALKEQGELEDSIKAYNTALAIKPDYAEAIENSLSLAVQLLPIITNYGYDFTNSETQVNSEVVLRPKYQVQNLIKTFLEGNFSKAHSHNKNFKACDRKHLGKLKPIDKVFCNAYSNFIGKLLEATWDEEPTSQNQVYHLGESHSLSYAHRNITIDGSNFIITSRITFGAKAFHFSRTKYDSFKAITKAHFVSLPQSSKIFLSYGEIDCRPNEGFISAASKLNKPLEELIDQTTSRYVRWFLEQNAGQRHHLYFINVPAPIYDENLTTDLNSEVARTVALFNAALKKYSLQHGFDTVDVFEFTVGKEGFSNGLFHIDNHHLGVKALEEIKRQLS